MKLVSLPTTTLALCLLGGPVLAHTPLFACYDNGDGTILCEGGFSDGSSAAGVTIRVLDGNDEMLLEDQLNTLSEIEFDKPEGTYTAVFDAGEGHRIEIPGSRILP
ncbi:hypothetical protein [Ectothiorhodospira lacustris]|uniref:hypothetical protein n=1 Tax=Ectothiorhodospira lacustris TaxID=2899127 RepID=UPI001EE899EB|nr:hypothetical protein [Ectothiorhodospira lacustris]MCG5501569.1 hypothetical protein [Ectothiorhodospira lacustris]MCG5511335.1 hypothetical protein [Ectothiorhodospira lacustris]MCG5523121.1 hypothetical protein [Ectothiorhodospira lacustris]